MPRGSYIRLDGLDNLINTLTEDAPRECKNLTRSAIHAIASQMAKDIKLVAPVGDTGNLRKSIRSKRNKPRKNGIFTSSVHANSLKKDKQIDAFYWKFIEYGTRKIKARPFIKPVKDRYRANMKELMEKSVLERLAKRLKKNAKKG